MQQGEEEFRGLGLGRRHLRSTPREPGLLGEWLEPGWGGLVDVGCTRISLPVWGVFGEVRTASFKKVNQKT